MRAILLLFFLTVSSWAMVPQPALPISLSSEVSPQLTAEVRPVLISALGFVKSFPPREYTNNLFQWTADRKVLEGKSFTIHLASSTAPFIQNIVSRSGAANTDAFTMSPVNTTDKSMKIILVLLVDRLLYDSNGKEWPDAFSRLVVALSHEIYGNTQHFLEFPIETAQKQTRTDRVRQEFAAFRASLSFLNELFKHPQFSILPQKVQLDFYNRLPHEIAGYNSWLSAHPGEQPDPTCEAILKLVKN